MALPLARALKAGVMLKIGLVSLPVSVHSTATENEDGDLRTVCTGTGAGKTEHALATVSKAARCPVCEGVEGFSKAHAVGEGFIPIPVETLAQAEEADLAPEIVKEINLNVHPAPDVAAATVPTGKSYYLSVKGAGDAYATLREMVRRTEGELAFLALFGVRGAPQPYQLVVEGEVLVLRQMADPAVVRERPQIVGSPQEVHVAQAVALAQQALSPFEPARYARPKNRILAAYVADKMPVEPAAAASNVVDLQSALVASLKAAQPAKKPARKKTKTAAADSKPATSRATARA